LKRSHQLSFFATSKNFFGTSIQQSIWARLCIPTEFRRIPEEFRHKASAVPVPYRNRHRNVL
jgi:hypothetical protein